MRLDFSQDRLLAGVANPDDAEYFCSGTLARAVSDGAAVAVCLLCRGDKGRPAKPIENLAAVRQAEMRGTAASLLKAEWILGDREDGRLKNTPELRAWLVDQYRGFRPTLVLAYAPNDYHADHRAASEAAEAASWYCTSRGHETESPVLGHPSAVWRMNAMNAAGFQLHFYIDVSEYLDLKRQLLACHESQLQRGSDQDFFPLMPMMERQNRFRGGQAGVQAAEAFRTHRAWKRVQARWREANLPRFHAIRKRNPDRRSPLLSNLNIGYDIP